jgi:hypothetical protein
MLKEGSERGEETVMNERKVGSIGWAKVNFRRKRGSAC